MAGNLVRPQRRPRPARPPRGGRLEPADDAALSLRQLDPRAGQDPPDIWVRFQNGDLRPGARAAIRLLRHAGIARGPTGGTRGPSFRPQVEAAVDPGHQHRARVRRSQCGPLDERRDCSARYIRRREWHRLQRPPADTLAAYPQRLIRLRTPFPDSPMAWRRARRVSQSPCGLMLMPRLART